MEGAAEPLDLHGDLEGPGVGVSILAVDDPLIVDRVQVVQPVPGPLDADLGGGGRSHDAERDQKNSGGAHLDSRRYRSQAVGKARPIFYTSHFASAISGF